MTLPISEHAIIRNVRSQLRVQFRLHGDCNRKDLRYTINLWTLYLGAAGYSCAICRAAVFFCRDVGIYFYFFDLSFCLTYYCVK